MAVALKRHEQVNAFNLVGFIVIITSTRRYCDLLCLLACSFIHLDVSILK